MINRILFNQTSDVLRCLGDIFFGHIAHRLQGICTMVACIGKQAEECGEIKASGRWDHMIAICQMDMANLAFHRIHSLLDG